MNREEAIETLGHVVPFATQNGEKIAEAIDMAIEALSVANLKEEFESAEYEDYEHATLVDIKEPLKVLVVRCKDCRRNNDGNFCDIAFFINDDGDGFCNCGERREP